MKRMTPRVLRAMALVSGLALVACSSDDPTDTNMGIPAGTFTATVTGDVTASFSGAAVQGEAAGIGPAGELGWILALGDFTPFANNAVFVSYLSARPPNGTYPLIEFIGVPWDPGEWVGALLLMGDPVDLSYFGTSLSGTVTITSSSADLVEGTYDFQVTDRGFLGNPPMLATVTGSFSAVGGAVEIPF